MDLKADLLSGRLSSCSRNILDPVLKFRKIQKIKPDQNFSKTKNIKVITQSYFITIKNIFHFLFIRLPEPFHFKSFRSPMAPPAKPILEGLHEDFLRFCEHHGLAAGYYLTNQIMDMFQGRLKNWDQIVGTVSTLFYLKIFFMGEIS